MAVLGKDELLGKLKAYLGEDTSDEAIALVEDVSDTVSEGTLDWKAKYTENDENWRRKYKERFFGGIDEGETVVDAPPENETREEREEAEEQAVTLDDLLGR